MSELIPIIIKLAGSPVLIYAVIASYNTYKDIKHDL